MLTQGFKIDFFKSFDRGIGTSAIRIVSSAWNDNKGAFEISAARPNLQTCHIFKLAKSPNLQISTRESTLK